MKFVKWEDDRFNTKQGSVLAYDKLEHFLLAFFGLLLLHYLTPFVFNNPSPPVALFTSNLFMQSMIIRALGIANEVKDAVVPYDRSKGLIQGFSWIDLISNELGIAVAVQFILCVSGVI